MANKTIKFEDPDSSKERTGEIVNEKFSGEQKWLDVRVDGIRWAIPDGWPNNASPICDESAPESYAEIFG